MNAGMANKVHDLTVHRTAAVVALIELSGSYETDGALPTDCDLRELHDTLSRWRDAYTEVYADGMGPKDDERAKARTGE